jgi:hypothetical protein
MISREVARKTEGGRFPAFLIAAHFRRLLGAATELTIANFQASRHARWRRFQKADAEESLKLPADIFS